MLTNGAGRRQGDDAMRATAGDGDAVALSVRQPKLSQAAPSATSRRMAW